MYPTTEPAIVWATSEIQFAWNSRIISPKRVIGLMCARPVGRMVHMRARAYKYNGSTSYRTRSRTRLYRRTGERGRGLFFLFLSSSLFRVSRTPALTRYIAYTRFRRDSPDSRKNIRGFPSRNREMSRKSPRCPEISEDKGGDGGGT